MTDLERRCEDVRTVYEAFNGKDPCSGLDAFRRLLESWPTQTVMYRSALPDKLGLTPTVDDSERRAMLKALGETA